MNDAVVVTGASGGIGRACVSQLTARGFTVLAAVRTDAQAASFESPVRSLRLDLSHPEQVSRAVEEVRSLGLPLRALVNNAGASRAGALEDLPLEATRDVLQVNLLGPLQLTRALIPELRPTRGRIINVGSGEGFLATPLNAPYCMAKHALEALSVSLRLELNASGIDVCVVSPGQTETSILTHAREQFAQLSSFTSPPYQALIAARARMAQRAGAPPARVANAIVRAITDRSPRSRYFVGLDSRGAFLLGRVMPDSVRQLVYRHLLGFR
jgi:NAD(P)-dependent dehydrogenase (short-subunit alcohol dehydrogenase family)